MSFNNQPTNVAIAGQLLTPDNDQINYQPPTIYNQNPVAQSYSISLVAGTPLTVNFPPNSTFFGLRMPIDNTVLVSVKGVSGDTGLPCHKLYGLPCFPFDSSISSIVLEAPSNVTVQFYSG